MALSGHNLSKTGPIHSLSKISSRRANLPPLDPLTRQNPFLLDGRRSGVELAAFQAARTRSARSSHRDEQGG